MAAGSNGIFIWAYILAIILNLCHETSSGTQISTDYNINNLSISSGEWQLQSFRDLSCFYRLYILSTKTNRHFCVNLSRQSRQTFRPPFGRLSFISLLLSGDVSLNPGPCKYPCGKCWKPVKSNQQGILCDVCNTWHHRKCTVLSVYEYNHLASSNQDWLCNTCMNPFIFTDSFFEDSVIFESHVDVSTDEHTSNGNTQNEDVFNSLRHIRARKRNDFLICHLNINSLRYKFDEIKNILVDKFIDCFVLAETKLDNSFLDHPFNIPGYKLFRRDRTFHGGGIAAFIRSDIPVRRRTDIESSELENIALEVTLV